MKNLTSKSVMQFQNDIGVALKSLRIKAGFRTSKSFAVRYDLPEIQYWRLENGRANVTLKSISKILKIHKIDIVEFFQTVEEYRRVASTTIIIHSGLLINQLAKDDLLLRHLF